MHSVAFTLIEPHDRDLGSFTVRRLLPSVQRQTVGPFIFFDELAPSTFPPGQGMDVRPHPHIGRATVTYLFLAITNALRYIFTNFQNFLGCNWLLSQVNLNANNERF
jgi:hypothetical protein